MMTWTTMVLCMLMERSRPILVARRLVCCGVVVSAIYFFPFLELAAFPDFFTGLAAAFLAAGLAAAFFAGLAGAAAACAEAGALLCPMPSSFFPLLVLTRGGSLRRPRIFFWASGFPLFCLDLQLKRRFLSAPCCYRRWSPGTCL